MTARQFYKLLVSNPVAAIPLGLGPTVAIDVFSDLNSLVHIPTALGGIYLANLLLDRLRPSGKPARSNTANLSS